MEALKLQKKQWPSIVSLAAAQIKGVAAMSGSMASGLTEKLGKEESDQRGQGRN